MPAPLPRHGELGIPEQPIVDRGPVRPYPQVRLAQIQDFQGDGSVTLDMFSDQVDELSCFYQWEEQETCHQAQAHLRGTALSYVRHAPFPPHTWEEVKTLLMKRFQPKDLMATYKAQFRSRCRCQMEDIYTYIETLQCLADLAWPFMDYHAKEKTVVDQFLLGIGNHELSVQVTAHGHRHIEDILRVARSLEAVQEDEKFHPRGHNRSTQARFVADERDHSPDTKQLVKDLLALLSRDVKSGQSVRKRPPTPGPRRVRSTDRKDTKPSANSSLCTPSREGWHGQSSSAEGRSRSRDGPMQCYRCKGYGHFAKDCPSEDFYKIGPNGLPIRVRDPSRGSSTERKKPEEK